MFYVQTRTYRARVGPVAKAKTATCENCHKTHEIRAHAWGEGTSVAMYDFSGGRVKNQEAAVAAATRNANLLADSALLSATCPACGEASAELRSQVEQASRAHARRRKLAAYVPIAIAALTFLPLGLRTFRQLAFSSWPLASAGAVAVSVGAFALTILLWPRKHPLRPNAAILSYRPSAEESPYRGDGPEPDFLAWPRASTSQKDFGSLGPALLALLASASLLGVGLFGLARHAPRFEQLNIVSMAPPGTKIRVSQPGIDDQVFEVRAASGDAYRVVAKVLSLDTPHPLTVSEEGPTRSKLEIQMPALKSNYGTKVLMLGAHAAGKCLAWDKPDEGLALEEPSPVHPDLVFSHHYPTTWLSRPSASEYSSALRLLPCAEASAREVRIASFAPFGTKLVLSQAGKADQKFTVGSRGDSDAYVVRARVYQDGGGTFTIREDESDYEQTFVLPKESPKKGLESDKSTWLIVTGAASHGKCVALLTSRYGNDKYGLGALGASPPVRKLSPTATDLWSIPHVDTWFAENPKSVTGMRYQLNLTRTAVRVKDCAVFDLLARIDSSSGSHKDDSDTEDDDEGAKATASAKPSATTSATPSKGRKPTFPPARP